MAPIERLIGGLLKMQSKIIQLQRKCREILHIKFYKSLGYIIFHAEKSVAKAHGRWL